MRSIDRRGDLRSVAMFSLDCLCKMRIVGAQLEFESVLADSKTIFQHVQLRLLLCVQVKMVMKEGMKLGSRRLANGKQNSADEDAGDRGRKSDGGDHEGEASLAQ